MDSEKKLGLSVVIPVYNESETLPSLIFRLAEVGDQADFPIEFILVDGFSNDDSTKILDDLLSDQDEDKFSCLFMNEKKGYGNDILQGLAVAKHQVLSWTHADLQTDPFDLITAFKIYISSGKENILVKGRRENRPLLDTLLTFGMQFFCMLTIKVSMSDINAQPKVFSAQFYESYLKENAPADFSLDLFLLYQARVHAVEIVDFPVRFDQRKLGIAKGGGGSWSNKWALIKRTFRYILNLKATLS